MIETANINRIPLKFIFCLIMMSFFAKAMIPQPTGSASLSGSASDLDGSEPLLALNLSSLGKTGGECEIDCSNGQS